MRTLYDRFFLSGTVTRKREIMAVYTSVPNEKNLYLSWQRSWIVMQVDTV